MRKLAALLLLFGLLVVLFGSILVNGAHTLVHFMDQPSTGLINPDLQVHVHQHPHVDGDHAHGSTLTLLLQSFNYQNMALLWEDVELALQWVLQLPVIVEEASTLLEPRPPTQLGKAVSYFQGVYASAPIDIPTPPPRHFFS